MAENMDNNRQSVTGIDFIGEVTFETGFLFAENVDDTPNGDILTTEVGGISGLTYDAANDIYYALSDDRGTRESEANAENHNDTQFTQFLSFAIDTETIPVVEPVTETPSEIGFGSAENPDLVNAPDADDPAIYVNSDNPEESFVITTFKNGGLRVYDLEDNEIQSITPEDIRYNNVDIAYGVPYFGQLVGSETRIDFAVVSDRANDTIAFFAIDPETKQLYKWDEGFEFPESIFGVDDEEATAYGLATYNSVVDGKNYVFVSQADGNKIAQIEFSATFGAADEPIINAEVVRTFEVPVPEGEDAADYQVEGMVVDRETGILYVAQEEFGIWKYNAEPNGSNEPTLVDTVTEDRDLEPVPFSNLVVFGDSFSDTGNVYNATEGLIPPSPPYFEGRFSNGELIVDAIANYLELPENESFRLGGNNYAFGAAETGEGTSEYGFLLPEPIDVPNIGQQIDLYLADRTPTQTDLFYVYGGTNDFVSPLLRGETLPIPEAIVANITTHITELAEAGAQTFVVPNLPSLGDLPLFLEQPEATAILNDVTEEFNQLLDTELDAIASELEVTIIEPDVYSIATEIQDNPADFGLSNTTDAFFNQIDPISDTTDLFLIGNPEEFFFWDIFHPTATATEIIAQEVIDILPSGVTQFTQFLSFAIDTETIPVVEPVFEVPVPEGEDAADYQVEGMVVDRETGYLYVAQEEFGIWKYNAEPNDDTAPVPIDTVTEDNDLEPVPFDNLVVFGDSLSDTGNLFNVTGGLIPPSPPYFEGRFSNGEIVIDAIAEFLELPASESFLEGGTNYAFGGAQIGEGTYEFDLLGDLSEPIDIPNIGGQIDSYLATQTPTTGDLFYIYGGVNNFTTPLVEGGTIPTVEEVVDDLTTHISELAQAGAETFIVPNLPPLENLPLFSGQTETITLLNTITEEFNQLLDAELDAIAESLNVTIIEPDIDRIVTEIQTNPADFGLTNVTDAVLNVSNLDLIGDPDEFFYWDTLHPTAVATDAISQEILDLLPVGTGKFTGSTPSLVPDIEGLTIYYGEDGNGYLIASSQGNSTFAIYDLAGSNSYLGSFAIKGVEESDGIDVTNVPLGDDYPAGLLVVQDGSNTPEVVFGDPEDGEIQNFNTNFKYVSLVDFTEVFPNAYDPRTPTVLSEFVVNPQLDTTPEPSGFNKVFGTVESDNLDITGARNFVFAGSGDDAINLTVDTPFVKLTL